jgi:hypothetical protein
MFTDKFLEVIGKEGVVSIVSCADNEAHLEHLPGKAKRRKAVDPRVCDEKDREKSNREQQGAAHCRKQGSCRPYGTRMRFPDRRDGKIHRLRSGIRYDEG